MATISPPPAAGATGATIPEGSTEQWKDKKRYLWLLGLVVPSLGFGAWGLVEVTGWASSGTSARSWSSSSFPPLDLSLRPRPENPPDEVMEWLENDKYYRWTAPTSSSRSSTPRLSGRATCSPRRPERSAMALVAKIGLALSVGMLGGIGINTAHELGHKKDALERWLAKITLAQTCYGHFYIEHNRGHHVRVATPEDPASRALRRDVLGVPAAQRVGQPEVVVGAGGKRLRSGRQEQVALVTTTCSTPGRCRWCSSAR